MIEVLKQMVEALEVDAYVYNGEKSWAAIKAGKQAIADLESQEPVVEMEALADNDSAYAYADGWNACVRKFKATHPPQRIEQNFCPRCGKRTNDIHTCTPPKEKNNGS